MKAILFDKPGDANVLYYGEAEQPTPQADELLVRVHATAINRADILQRRGNYPAPAGASSILGLELAGEVVADKGPWKKGDRIMAVVSGGSYAEYATVPIGMAMPIPDRLSYEEAAAIPEAYLTAWLNLFHLGQLQSGQSVLIHAGASGIGTAAIQLAHAVGATVFTTAGSQAKLMRCADLGAEVLINYKTESFRERVLEHTNGQGVNLILDFIGAPYWNDNLASLALNGRIALIGFLGGSAGQLDLGALMSKRITVLSTTLRRTPLDEKIALTQQLSDFALPRLQSGDLQATVDRIYPLEQAAQAHLDMEANQNIGKIVLSVA
jgi:tumor protein p53-inducible protein 3